MIGATFWSVYWVKQVFALSELLASLKLRIQHLRLRNWCVARSCEFDPSWNHFHGTIPSWTGQMESIFYIEPNKSHHLSKKPSRHVDLDVTTKCRLGNKDYSSQVCHLSRVSPHWSCSLFSYVPFELEAVDWSLKLFFSELEAWCLIQLWFISNTSRPLLIKVLLLVLTATLAGGDCSTRGCSPQQACRNVYELLVKVGGAASSDNAPKLFFLG